MGKSARSSQDGDRQRSAKMLEAVRTKLGVLNKNLRLEFNEGNLRVVFEGEVDARDDKFEGTQAPEACVALMRTDLKELLDRRNGARDVLAHLAATEHALKSLGLAAFGHLPAKVLQRAVAQLEGVVSEPVSAGIAELRSRLTVTLKAHAAIEQHAQRVGPSSFLVDDKLQVSESSVSDFMQVVEEAKQR